MARLMRAGRNSKLLDGGDSLTDTALTGGQPARLIAGKEESKFLPVPGLWWMTRKIHC